MDFARILGNVRDKKPLIHCITNYVTANDCANILLACGASPVMADAPEEAEEIERACDGLTLNLGTFQPHTLPAMLLAGKAANRLGHAVVLDPVGVGASALRAEAARTLLRELRIDAIRGNASEIRALAEGGTASRGVDAAASEPVSDIGRLSALAGDAAKKAGAVVALTGETDVVTDGKQTCLIFNGHPDMRLATGAGCMLSALTAAFAAANPGNTFEAVCAAVCGMGLCGEKARARLEPPDGNAALRGFLIDAVFHLSAADFQKGARYEMC